MKIYQIAHFHNHFVQIKSLKFFDPQTKNPEYTDFSKISVLSNICQPGTGGTDISDPNINHLLEIGMCFPSIYEQIL